MKMNPLNQQKHSYLLLQQVHFESEQRSFPFESVKTSAEHRDLHDPPTSVQLEGDLHFPLSPVDL